MIVALPGLFFYLFWEEMSKINFQDGGHLGFSMRSVFSYFVSTKRPYAHHPV